jgi:hypothetical protein
MLLPHRRRAAFGEEGFVLDLQIQPAADFIHPLLELDLLQLVDNRLPRLGRLRADLFGADGIRKLVGAAQGAEVAVFGGSGLVFGMLFQQSPKLLNPELWDSRACRTSAMTAPREHRTESSTTGS